MRGRKPRGVELKPEDTPRLETVVRCEKTEQLQSRDQILDNLYLANCQGAAAFSAQGQRLIEMLATHAAMAIERARLYRQIEQEARAKAALLQKLQAANERLRELDDVKSEFVSLVSHELRAPLTNMQCAVDLLREELATEAATPARELLQVLDEQIGRQTRLVQGLLDVARFESGQLTVEQQPVVLQDHLTEIVRELRVRAPRHQFVLPAMDAALRIAADPDWLDEILTNLLDNAVKYSPAGGQITVRVRSANDRMVISVSDQGIGIPPDELGNIFDKFHRVADGDSEGVSGHGLGLYITRKLVEAHGGQIGVESV